MQKKRKDEEVDEKQFNCVNGLNVRFIIMMIVKK
jgi:hypothetical protein